MTGKQKRIFLGFSGKPRHGKDTAAAAILREFPQAKIYSISDLICAELGLARNEVRDVSILQAHSHKRCAKDPLYWARQIAEAIERDAPHIAIITNVRRWDEAQFYRGMGCVLVRVTSLNPNGSPYVPRDRDMNDPLETELDGYNFDYHLTAKRKTQIRWLERQAFSLVCELQEGQ